MDPCDGLAMCLQSKVPGWSWGQGLKHLDPGGQLVTYDQCFVTPHTMYPLKSMEEDNLSEEEDISPISSVLVSWGGFPHGPNET